MTKYTRKVYHRERLVRNNKRLVFSYSVALLGTFGTLAPTTVKANATEPVGLVVSDDVTGIAKHPLVANISETDAFEVSMVSDELPEIIEGALVIPIAPIEMEVASQSAETTSEPPLSGELLPQPSEGIPAWDILPTEPNEPEISGVGTHLELEVSVQDNYKVVQPIVNRPTLDSHLRVAYRSVDNVMVEEYIVNEDGYWKGPNSFYGLDSDTGRLFFELASLKHYPQLEVTFGSYHLGEFITVFLGDELPGFEPDSDINNPAPIFGDDRSAPPRSSEHSEMGETSGGLTSETSFEGISQPDTGSVKQSLSAADTESGTPSEEMASSDKGMTSVTDTMRSENTSEKGQTNGRFSMSEMVSTSLVLSLSETLPELPDQDRGLDIFGITQDSLSLTSEFASETNRPLPMPDKPSETASDSATAQPTSPKRVEVSSRGPRVVTRRRDSVSSTIQVNQMVIPAIDYPAASILATLPEPLDLPNVLAPQPILPLNKVKLALDAKGRLKLEFSPTVQQVEISYVTASGDKETIKVTKDASGKWQSTSKFIVVDKHGEVFLDSKQLPKNVVLTINAANASGKSEEKMEVGVYYIPYSPQVELREDSLFLKPDPESVEMVISYCTKSGAKEHFKLVRKSDGKWSSQGEGLFASQNTGLSFFYPSTLRELDHFTAYTVTKKGQKSPETSVKWSGKWNAEAEKAAEKPSDQKLVSKTLDPKS